MALEFGEEVTDLDIRDQFVQFSQEVFDDIITSGRWWHQNVTYNLTLVDSTSVYTLPVTISEVRDVRRQGDGVRVALTTVEQLIRRSEDLTQLLAQPPGPLHLPTHWFPAGAASDGALQIQVWPVPNGDQTDLLNVYALKRPATLALTSTIPLPEEYINVARSGVRALVRYNENNLEAAALMFQRFDAKLRLLNGRFQGAPRAGSRMAAKRGLKITPQMPSAPGGD
jgi:hypothetical protein